MQISNIVLQGNVLLLSVSVTHSPLHWSSIADICQLSLYMNQWSENVFPFLADLSVMARQVNPILCSPVGSHSTTHCCLYDQSVHSTGKLY